MNRYEKSWRYLFNKLPNWKRAAITEDQKAGKDSSLLSAFIKEVISLAEKPGVIPAVSEQPISEPSVSEALPANVPPWHATNGANGIDE